MPTDVLERGPVHAGSGPPAAGTGDGGDGNPVPRFVDPTLMGLWAFLGTVSMLFLGFTSAYMLRRSAADWTGLAAPLPMWIGTAALVASSGVLEVARRRLRGWDLAGARAFLGLTGLLGAVFLAGQVVSWRSLAAQGVFLATHAHASFFYVLTGVHAVHVLGGAAWYAVVQVRLRRLTLVPGQDGLRLFATYWHFLGALWLYLAWLLFAF